LTLAACLLVIETPWAIACKHLPRHLPPTNTQANQTPPLTQVAEPKQDNSGIPQGIFVRRHQVPKGDGSGAIVTPRDLAVGSTVTVYGRTFYLVDADASTRRWFVDILQQEQGEAQGYPADQVDAYRTKFGLATAPGR